MNLADLDLRPWKRSLRARQTSLAGAEGTTPAAPGTWPHATACGSSGDRPPRPVTPGCRLWLEGWEARDGACDIVELSPEGVTIAIPDGRRSRWGQRGQLLIGQVGGDHYVLPVAVRGVKHCPSASIVELAFPDNERWAYRRA
ncbi:MAG: hypothetical protein ACK587_10915 [Cyanobacteriota bacterium]